MTSRRHRHEGTITEIKRRRKDGSVAVTYHGRVSGGIDPSTGRYIRTSVYGKTKQDVINKMSRLRVDMRRNRFTSDPERLTLEQYIDQWLQTASTSRREFRRE